MVARCRKICELRSYVKLCIVVAGLDWKQANQEAMHIMRSV